MNISWPVLNVSQTTPEDFVQFWDRLYSDSEYSEEFYQKNIGQLPTEEEEIEKWFVWKNAGPLSAGKKESIRRYVNPEERIAHDVDADTLRKFLNRGGGTIWRIFWLHLQHPQHFPIYDQHVHRAMAFLVTEAEGKLPQEIPDYDPTKVSIYLEHYRPFFARFEACARRQVDRALWSFGKFLKLGYGQIFTFRRD